MKPTDVWIKDTKAKFGKLFKTEIAGEDYYFRQIRRGEHLSLQKEAFPNGVPSDAEAVSAEDNARLEGLIVAKCVVWPENVDLSEIPAGAVPMLVALIMRHSGFGLASEPEEV